MTRDVVGDLLRVDDRLPLGAPYTHTIKGNVISFEFRVPVERVDEPWTHFQLFLGQESIVRPVDSFPMRGARGDTVTVVQRVDILFR